MRLLQIDAFTSRAFGGNPAAVCLLDREVDDLWMQRVASEMNLPETAFLTARDDGSWSLRWFTPTVEVDLCGHATLASAHALWEERLLDVNTIARFHTRSGLLTAQRDGDRIELNFPATPATETETPPRLAEALGTRALFVGYNGTDLLVEVESDAIVEALKPNLALIATVPARGVIVTAVSARADADFVSRFFAPQSGIDEDPATGSAHCTLAPFWSPRLGRTTFRALQLSARRGELAVTLDGDRVRLAGNAVTILRGELVV
ncbi:MAG TPA: PhzF family phenazine biosynthesis protein [Thermoanaerobaculia bacterium]|nr:PhzF family phenazine biosynthesis protein [Thermoanaerobaculia bacterium]